MASDERVRLEVAFDGGQTIGALVPGEIADEFRRALDASDGGVFELEADDGRYIVALRRVVYVKRFSRETRIGFGAAP